MERQTPFFRPGGTLDPRAESYLRRSADAVLLRALLDREYVYLLDSRQKGKSSMVARAIVGLRERGVRTVKLDLQRVGANVSPEQWYAGLLAGVGDELGLSAEVFGHWAQARPVGPMARWIGTLGEVVLPAFADPIVVFVDEVDFVRALPFSTDEFFAGIRDCYNRRAESEAFGRLTFCLVGVATPSQLIRHPKITPFNIGRRLDLTDFTLEETRPFAYALDARGVDGAALVERIHYWANGHPYLTQLLCSLVADAPGAGPETVDRIVRETLLNAESRAREPNLADVERRLLEPDLPAPDKEEQRCQVLDAYGQVLRGRTVEGGDDDPLVATLRLSGVCV
ncbi:MAG: AAA-like domain-containing protein, partial [Chthonomonadaceae bacterium]|nr:AAA-like domain-containing protein [Chthonomonadaceae bacterium]